MAPEASTPQILVPYPGPDATGRIQDIFVYLRPETNGVLAESVLLKVVQSCSQFKTGIKLAYLANFPGAFIVANHIVERHYAHKFFFAVHGKRVFTSGMREAFERHFRTSFAEATILGSFEALHALNQTPESLFSRWVPAGDMLHVDGQSIKRYDHAFVVNYDIPALLHKNTRNTDIAVMLFRCNINIGYFRELATEMREALVEKKILSANVPASRAFHYSKGPMEQVLDATDYLRTPNGAPVALDQLSFVVYARDHGISIDELLGVIRSPICVFEQADGTTREESVFTYTAVDGYDEALAKLRTIQSQLWIR